MIKYNNNGKIKTNTYAKIAEENRKKNKSLSLSLS